MPKILIVTDNTQEQINGVVTTFKNLETHAVSNGYDVEYLDPSQFAHCACPGYPEVKLSWPWGIGKKIKAIEPDFIHIATEGPVGLFARWWCERNGHGYNTSYHTDFPKFLSVMYHVPAAWTYAYLRWFHKNSHKVLVTTETIRRDLIAHGFSDTTVWTRGVDRSILPSIVRANNKHLPVVLCVGRVSPEKGLDQLIEIQNRYFLIIVGDGPYREEAQRLLPNALFLGYKQGHELINQYHNADVFVFPSSADTFGLVMIEAMAQGTPVAAFPVQGPIDVVEPGVNGWLDQNLVTAVEHCLLLDRAKVQQASQKWTWEACWQIFERNLISVPRSIRD